MLGNTLWVVERYDRGELAWRRIDVLDREPYSCAGLHYSYGYPRDCIRVREFWYVDCEVNANTLPT